MKRLLIVSPHFPPVNAPDAQRVLGALPHLRSLGWETRVLCVDPRDIDLPADSGSVADLPADVRIERCRAWPLALTRPLGLRTLGRRAFGSLQRAGLRIIAGWKPDLVYFSTTQNRLVAVGPRWKRATGVPFIVDVQDPWVTDFYDRPGAPRPPGGWKYALSRRQNAGLEREVFPAADGVTAVSPAYLDDLDSRHPAFARVPRLALPFGIDTAAFARAVATAPVPFRREPGKIHLVSLGAVGPIMHAAVTALCARLHGLRVQNPALAGRLRIHFIGTSYAPGSAAVPSVLPIARAHQVDDLIDEIPSRVPWREAQAGMAAADALVVLTSTDPAYTPSKLAGCFLARRPVLLIAPPESASARLAEELGLGVRMDIDGGPPGALPDFLSDLLAPAPVWPSRRREDHFARHHTAAARTRRLADFFEHVLISRSTSS